MLKPLNFLLGANSSGKSSFARVFPLFRQSIETKTKGPILWFGELVDFGSFKESLNKSKDSDSISFSFGITVPTEFRPRAQLAYLTPTVRFGSEPLKSILKLTIRAKGNESYLAEYDISFLDDSLTFRFDENGRCRSAQINETSFSEILNEYRLVSLGQLVQHFISPDEDGGVDSYRFRRSGFINVVPSLEAQALRRFSAYFDGRTKQERRYSVLQGVLIADHVQMKRSLGSANNADQKLISRTHSLDPYSEEFRELRDHLLLARVPRLLSYFDYYLSALFNDVSYIKPLRASASRYYRVQNLSVKEIDSDGSNLPAFLNSLSVVEKDRFESWMDENLSFFVRAEDSGSHISLQLKHRESSVAFNVADLGFGFSQILPVIVQLWLTASRPLSPQLRGLRSGIPNKRIVVVEQPELHLHPAMQAMVIELFVSVLALAKKSDIGIVFIIETHSETFINRVGHLVASGRLPRESAQILVFNRSVQSDSTSVIVSDYDQDGVLTNWPTGFFKPRPLV